VHACLLTDVFPVDLHRPRPEAQFFDDLPVLGAGSANFRTIPRAPDCRKRKASVSVIDSPQTTTPGRLKFSPFRTDGRPV
jgi:hypothetical protein